MARPRTAEDILVKELKGIHSAERQLARAIPRFSRRITSETLRRKLDERRDRGTGTIEHLDAIFQDLEVTKARPKNAAVEGILEDLGGHLEEIDEAVLHDPVLLGGMQKLQHYCIASWGTTASLGRLLEEDEITALMERLLDGGKRFDEELTVLAESEINPAMLEDEEE